MNGGRGLSGTGREGAVESGAGAGFGFGLDVSHALHRSAQTTFSSVHTAHAHLPSASFHFLRLAVESARASPPVPAAVNACSFDMDG